MFTKRTLGITIILSILIISLAAALVISGPRIRKADYDVRQLTEYSNQTIILRANQPLNNVEPSQISIEPAADFSVNTTGDNVIIQLKERLKYQTHYTVTARNLSNSKNQQSNYTTAFTTPDLEYYYLKRGEQQDEEKQVDTIIDSKTSKSVYEADYIFDFDVVGPNLAIITGENRNNELLLLNAKSSKKTLIKLPASGTVDNLRASPNNKLLGFTLRSNETGTNKAYDDTLFMYDLEAQILTQPKGVSDKPISSGGWEFAPDSTSIIVQTYDAGTLIVDTLSKNKPIPLGSYTTLRNFSGDGKKLSATATDGSVIIDLPNNSKAPVETTSIRGIIPYVTTAHLLQNSDDIVRSLYLYQADTQFSHTIIDIGSGSSFKELIDLDEQKTSLLDYTVTPNDQFLAYEAHPIANKQAYDDYNTGSRPLRSYTKIIDTSSGKEIADLNGINIVWKRF